ncbi:N-acetylmuramoyl-L-alanine amidase family protein [Clostridium magnum]|uniref:N-acetylmuramoyl-L-alanine amidase AmiC n=1 Tax=Clostridium magnum DSM 2767 TaxID=1121326 RepID=A0A162R698_9CLOT|nr:N-acetylmuramoyl-L-alanine amidase [Clostridium magnum]KZL89493.1 N-acetylmuramoyl-L-alanine amidase AmiC precursor [Clostridium magnum DSM 2767]SHH70446.1 N-acetylmuramoyl-L-alanine amidase [Clostridium magnum DSM 2767]
MNFKLKVTSLCILLIFLFVGCSKTASNVSNENKNNEVTQSTSISKTSDKEKDDKDNSKKVPENNQQNKKQNVENEKSKEVKKKVVVLDPGHGNRSNLEKEAIYPGSTELKIKDGGGAEGVNSKTPEYVIAMGITMKLKVLLENKGYAVIMTKTTPQESPGNIERAEVGNKNNADLVIRVHADSSESSNTSGASILIPATIGYAKDISEISRKYGEIILESLINEVGMKNKGLVERSDLTGFNWSKVPVILVETGFLSNPQEDRLLNTEEYQSKIAKGLFNGIDKALSN